MKQLFALIAAVVLIGGCTGLNDQVDNDGKNNTAGEAPEFFLADLRELTKDYDVIICKDVSHVILANFYEDGLAESFHIISEMDTIAIAFAPNGLPEVLTNGRSHVQFVNFSHDSARISLIDSEGNYEFMDWDAGIKWADFFTLAESGASSVPISKATAASDKMKLKHAQSLFVESLVRAPFRLKYGLASNLAWCVEGLGYMVSDNPTWQRAVKYSGDTASITINVADVVASYGVSAAGALVLANLYVWSNVVNKIIDGIINDQYGNPFVKEPELYAHLCEGGIWLPANGKGFKWPGSEGVVAIPLKIGYANFDISTLEWGIRPESIPSWCKVETFNQGYNSYFTIEVQECSEPGVHTAALKIWVAGVYNVEDDLNFNLRLSSKVYADPSAIEIKDSNPVTVRVYSPSEESWQVQSVPAGYNVERRGIATDSWYELVVTPTGGGIEYGDILLSVNSVKGETYNVSIPVIKPLCPDNNHPHAIDMGVGLKWSCCNVGASLPEGYGGYYAWGETEECSGWNSNYKYYLEGKIIKYCTNGIYGYNEFYDGKTVLDTIDDVARTRMGGKWRMPTDTEWTELMAACSWRWTTRKGVNGGLLTSKNGNSIFLPAAGSMFDIIQGSGSNGWYWSSTLNISDPRQAWGRYNISSGFGRNDSLRNVGHTVRAVSE